jgi:protoporphyrinogen oxidase
MPEKKVIMGAGLAGLSAAYHLKDDYQIYEKEAKIGGLASSEEINGFIFDFGLHVLHTKNRYVLNLLYRLLRNDFPVQYRQAWIFIYGTYIKYPFQANLYGLPVKIVKECVLDFVKSKFERKNNFPINYSEWLFATFGKGIANHFMIPYSKRMWMVDPTDLTLEWVNVRFPQPTLDEVLEGALNIQEKEFGPNATFRYPLYNGIQAIANAFLSKVKNINLDHEASKVDLKKKKIYFKNGIEVFYDKLISTIPLPELVRIIEEPPIEIRNAVKGLKYTSDFCVNIGIDSSDLQKKHWIYFPEKRFPFLRISMTQNLSPCTVPKGERAIQTEIFYSKSKRINKKSIVQHVINSLIELGLIRNSEEIVFTNTKDIKYAYVIYTHDRKKNVKVIHDFLKKNDVYPAGRFGEWQYLWMDQAILSGKNAASEFNKHKKNRL